MSGLTCRGLDGLGHAGEPQGVELAPVLWDLDELGPDLDVHVVLLEEEASVASSEDRVGDGVHTHSDDLDVVVLTDTSCHCSSEGDDLAGCTHRQL